MKEDGVKALFNQNQLTMNNFFIFQSFTYQKLWIEALMDLEKVSSNISQLSTPF